MSLAVEHATLDSGSPPSASVAAEAPSVMDGVALDALVDALMAGGDASGRAQVICAVLDEMSAGVSWLQAQDPSRDEEASLQLVLDAAFDHRRRMSMSCVDSGAGPAGGTDPE